MVVVSSEAAAAAGLRWRLAEVDSPDSLFVLEDVEARGFGAGAVLSSTGEGTASAALLVFFFDALLDCIGIF